MSRKTHRRLQIGCRVHKGLCFLWMLGLAGSSDLNTITTAELLWKLPLAVFGFGLFFWLGGDAWWHCSL